MPMELVTLCNHLILCCPCFLLPSIFPNNRFFSNELGLCIRQPKYWSFSFSISPSKEYSGLISFTLSHFSHVRLFATPSDCSPPGSSIHGILQARILEWVAISFSKGSSQPRDWTHVSYVFYIGGRILNHWATWEAQNINTNPLRNIMVCRRFMADHYSNFGSNELFFKSITVQNGLQVSDLWL